MAFLGPIELVSPTVCDTGQHTPWTDFQSSITPHQNLCRYQRGCRWKDLADTFPKTCLLALKSCWVRSSRALKIGPGGVLSCVTYGTCTVGRLQNMRESPVREGGNIGIWASCLYPEQTQQFRGLHLLFSLDLIT